MWCLVLLRILVPLLLFLLQNLRHLPAAFPLGFWFPLGERKWTKTNPIIPFSAIRRVGSLIIALPTSQDSWETIEWSCMKEHFVSCKGLSRETKSQSEGSMPDGWIIGKWITVYTWPESEGHAKERTEVSFQNGTVESSHVESESRNTLELEQPTSFGPWAGIRS